MRIHAEVSRLNGRYQGCAAAPGRPGICTGFSDSPQEAWLTLHDAICRVAGNRRMSVGSSPMAPQRRTYIIGGDDA